MRYKKIIFSNELSTKGKLNGSMMKNVSAGGDGLVGRTHGKEETIFTPHFIANHMMMPFNTDFVLSHIPKCM